MKSIDFLGVARQLLTGVSLADFASAYAHQAVADDDMGFRPGSVEADRLWRTHRHLARQLWASFPAPEHQWRARGLPKAERNAACDCGSGRKYKHCCAEFERQPVPPLDGIWGQVFAQLSPHELPADALVRMPGELLAALAQGWSEQGQDARVIDALEPIFLGPSKLDNGHEMALDVLLDAMLDQGLGARRLALVTHLQHHANKRVATTARCRWVTVLADQGQDEQAWALFRETQRFNPSDPQLMPLELSLLLGAGREEEARQQAPLLAARARRLGYPDLAQSLMDLADRGLAGMRQMSHAGAHGDAETHVDGDWLDLLQDLPESVDAQALRRQYEVEHVPVPDAKDAHTRMAWISPKRATNTLHTRWARAYPVGEPMLTRLDADVEAVLEDLPSVRQFMRQNPQAWTHAQVLSDLLLSGLALLESSDSARVMAACRALAAHAETCLAVLADGAQVHWGVLESRPWLRALAVGIELAQMDGDSDAMITLLRRGLAYNPHDNHGWRFLLVPQLLRDAQAEAALEVLNAYPDDMPPAEHMRALALFMLGHHQEAEAVLRAAHAAYPLYADMLLPEALDAPKQAGQYGMTLGGAHAAWLHREDMRPQWLRSGALAWLRQLNLPPTPAPARRGKGVPAQPRPSKGTARVAEPAQRLGAPAAPKSTPQAPPSKSRPLQARPFSTAQDKLLRKCCSQYERLHGLLSAVAWAPNLIMPGSWARPALALLDTMPKVRTEHTREKGFQDALHAIGALYNAIVAATVPASEQAPLPVGVLPKDAPDAAVWAWAAGFLAGAELDRSGWAKRGHKVGGMTGPFGRLGQLAARAPRLDERVGVLDAQGRPQLSLVEPSADVAHAELMAALSALWADRAKT